MLIAAFRHADHRGALGTDRIHHSADVVHTGFEIRRAADPVRQACPALVEQDDTRKCREPGKKADPGGVLPPKIEVGHEARYKHQVQRPAARHLVGDTYIAAFRISDFRHVHSGPPDAIDQRLS